MSLKSNDVRIKSTKILNFLVHDILDYGQLESDKFRQNLSYSDLRDSINEILDVLNSKASSRGITLVS